MRRRDTRGFVNCLVCCRKQPCEDCRRVNKYRYWEAHGRAQIKRVWKHPKDRLEEMLVVCDIVLSKSDSEFFTIYAPWIAKLAKAINLRLTELQQEDQDARELPTCDSVAG